MADQSNPTSDQTPRQRVARADINIDEQEHNLLLSVKMTRNRLTGKQVVRFEFEVAADYIKVVDIHELNPDPVLALRR